MAHLTPKVRFKPGLTLMREVLLLALCIHYCLSDQEKWCFDRTIHMCTYQDDNCNSCGDGWCKCLDNEAYCDVQHYEPMKHIPQLPKTVKRLDYSENSVLAESLVLHEQLFSSVMHITHLWMTDNNIKHIPINAFRQLRNLTCLNIDNNEIDFTDIRNALSSAPSLHYFSAYDSKSATLEDCNFSGIHSKVKEMELSHISTAMLDLSCFCAFHSIELLNFEWCEIKKMTLNCTLNVKKLLLRANKLRQFPVTSLSNSLLPNLEFLDLSINRVEQQSMILCYLPNLRYLDLTRNLLPDAIAPINRDFVPKLEVLLLDRQSKPRYPAVISKPESFSPLKTLSLAGNNQNFAKKAYAVQINFLTTIVNLTLDENDFLDVDDEQFEKHFDSLWSLQVFSLKKCNLEKVSMRMFKMFPKLQFLDLSMNRISDSVFPNGALNSLQHLTVLFLPRNKIGSVPENLFSSVLTKQLRKLFLPGNPFVCSCDLLWFKRWLTQDKKLFGNINDYFCDNFPKTAVVDFTLTEQQCLLSHQASVLIITVCSLVIITLTAFILLFGYRWYIRLLLYEAFRGRGDIRRQRLLANNFDYDVFISYASEDLAWVREHLMPQLEGNLGLRLCIHERDFIPGHNIVDNIAECVESSKKIMMVFSKDFVLSQWCQFELSYCLSHVMDYDDVLIIVCVDDVTSRRMTTTMMAVLKTTTYIQWEELDDAINAFWGRLRLALNEIFIGENQV